MISSAVISDDGRYRYRLDRRWGGGPTALWVMLNPSTADASEDDSTIRKVIGFSQRWGMGAAVVVNLFALRSTDPDQIGLLSDFPVGPENAPTIRAALAEKPERIIAAWGSHRITRSWPAHIANTLDMLCIARPVECLGTNADAQPKHPLYLSYRQPLRPLDRMRRRPFATV